MDLDPIDSKANTRSSSKLTSTIPQLAYEKDIQVEQRLISSSDSNPASTTKETSQAHSINKTSATSRRQDDIIENFLTLWLDSNTATSSNDDENSIVRLQSTVNSIKIFNNDNECSNFIHNIKDYKVILIVSNGFNRMYMSFIHDLPQLNSIYLLSVKTANDECILKEWRKIKGVFSDISVICNQIKQDTQQHEHNLMPFSVVPAFFPVNMNELDSSFMYSQLLKEILLGMQYDEKAKREFVHILRIQYAANNVTLRSIDKFEQDYDKPTPIWWYTKESFIYSVLNKALRTQDIEIIIKMGFIVRDLCKQIEQVYSQTRQETKQIVYRGQGMSNTEFEKIKESEGGLLSFNSFLSTSTDQQVALTFADSARIDPDLIGIVFQIEIDTFISSTHFASLNGISYYSDTENEILFSMHSVFRIGNILKIDDRLWQVNLKLTNDNDELLKSLTEYIRKDFEGVAENHRLGTLMRRMDKLDKAKEIFTEQLELTSDESLSAIADLHSELGGIKSSQGDALNALTHFEKALAIKEKILLSTDPDLAKTYSSIGTAYCSMANYSNALLYHEKALKIREKVLSPMHPELGTAYSNLGVVHYAMGQYSTALSYYEKARNIREKILPSIHSTLAITYNNIGRVHKAMGNYPMALSFYEKTLQIEQKSLPPTHSSFGTTYNNIAGVHLAVGDYSAALMYLEKTLQIQKHSLSPTHPDLATTYNNIGTVYTAMNDYLTALSNFEKALELQQKSLPRIHPTLGITFCNIGQVYKSMGDCSKALSYYQKTLEIQKESLRSSHPDLASTYNKMGYVFNSLGHYKEAVRHAEQAVDIIRNAFGCNHPTFQTYQENLEQFRQQL